jgi:glycine/D-amino acid oxidase-like deaminating enzyme
VNVAVVGGGAVGVTAAHDLARTGAAVTLYERGDLAAGASGRAAGVLYDAYADRRDARLARRALARFREFSGRADFEFTPCPYVWLARERDDRRAAAIRRQVPRMREHGVDAELLDGATLAEQFPALRTDDVAVAGVAAAAGHADPGSYVGALAERARDAGADLRTDAEASVAADPPAVEAGGDARRFDAVLVAAGAHTADLLAAAGIQVPLKPYRVQALTGSPDYAGPMVYDATAGFYARPHPAGLLAGDGTEPVEADPDDWARDGDDWFVAETHERLARRLGVDLGVERAWAGLCVATPDRDPLLGAVAEGVYVAAGWQGHGFMRSPALGEAAAEAILGGDPVPGFDPDRFDGDEAFEVVEGMAIDEP